MKRIVPKKVGLAFLSLVFALMLFLTASLSSYNAVGNRNKSNNVETYTHTLENVPIDIKYDSDKYFISGYSYETQVYLTSTNRVKLDGEINSDTRKFKVVADLSQVVEGTNKVPLSVLDLPSDMTAEVTPAEMTVTVGLRETKTFPIQLDQESLNLADGYLVADAGLDVGEVTVTSDTATLEQIDQVRAVLLDDDPINSDGDYPVSLQAISTSGTVLPTVINPAKVSLNLKLKRLTKTVPVRVVLTGQVDSSLSQIAYEAQYTEVVIAGSQDKLDAIDELVVTVDISNIKKSATKPVPLSAEGVSVTPSTMSLKLTVTKKNNDS